jgi:opacity protein-like surface antigen
MLHRHSVGPVAGLVAGFVLVAAIARPVGAQVVPTKKATADTMPKPVAAQGHIKIQKELKAAGEVCLPLKCGIDQDSVDRAIAAVRAEDLAREAQVRAEQRRADSIGEAARIEAAVARLRATVAAARERARMDSIAGADAAEREAQLAQKRHLARGFYFGFAGGASTPQRDIRNGYTGGWNATVPFGWDDSDSPIGVRTDVAVDHLNGTRYQDQSVVTTAASGDLTVWSLNADLKLRMHTPGTASRSHVYVLGGIGAHRVMNGVYGTIGTRAGENLSFGDAKTNFGWNVGAGASMAWGPTELFIESRFFHVKSDLPYHMNGGVGTYTSFTPFVVGVQWF